MVRALDSRSRGREFESRPFNFHVTTLGKLFTLVSLSPSSIIWYWSKVTRSSAGKGVMAAYRWVYDLSPAG